MQSAGTKPDSSSAQHRILEAAASLFATFGYGRTSTRHIATAAEVNEVTIYRHFPRKRDLYLAVIRAELQKLTLRGDLLAQIAEARDARTALACTFRLIVLTLQKQERVLRLVEHTFLEMNEDFDPILRLYLGELIDVISQYLEPWVVAGKIRCSGAKVLTLTLLSLVLSHRPLHRVFVTQLPAPETMLDIYTNLCIADTDGRRVDVVEPV